MSKRKYNYKIVDKEALAAAFPAAVTVTEVPATTETKVNHGVISKLLDCKIIVPGIELETPTKGA